MIIVIIIHIMILTVPILLFLDCVAFCWQKSTQLSYKIPWIKKFENKIYWIKIYILDGWTKSFDKKFIIKNCNTRVQGESVAMGLKEEDEKRKERFWQNYECVNCTLDIIMYLWIELNQLSNVYMFLKQFFFIQAHNYFYRVKYVYLMQRRQFDPILTGSPCLYV